MQTASRAARSTTRTYAKSRGLNVAYSLTGDGPIDLVLVPGFVSNLEAVFELPAIERGVKRLASFARVISFDKPGTGLSDPIEVPRPSSTVISPWPRRAS